MTSKLTAILAAGIVGSLFAGASSALPNQTQMVAPFTWAAATGQATIAATAAERPGLVVRTIGAPSTWICTPAGFGTKSTCRAG